MKAKNHSEIPLSQCSIGQFTEAIMKGNGLGNESTWLKAFFQDQPFTVVEEMLQQYKHNVCQYALPGFLKELKFNLVKETFYDESGEVAVTYENLECDKDKFKKVYKQAFLMYENKNGEKLALSINKFSSREIVYRFYAGEYRDTVMADFMAYSVANNMYRGKKIDGDCAFLELSNVTWEDVILPEQTKQVVRSNVAEMFTMKEYLVANDISLKGGTILSGSPGTGKTQIAKVLAKEIDATVIYAMPDQLRHAQDIKRICEMAKDLAPCMLIIEDIDYIAEDRETGNKGAVIELMNYLDGVQEFKDVVTLATTNAVDVIENAIKNRPGRFDRIINVPNPNPACRLQMLKKFTEKYIISGVINFDDIVKKTEGLSGAHIKELCKTAAKNAIRDKSYNDKKIAIVMQKHFDMSLKEVMNIDYATFNKTQNAKRKVGFNHFDDDLL